MKHLVNLSLEITWKIDNIPNRTAVLGGNDSKQSIISKYWQLMAVFNKELQKK